VAHPETNIGDDGAVTPARRRADGGGPKHRPGETDRPDGVNRTGMSREARRESMPRLRDGPRVPEWRVLPDTERRVGAHRGRCLGRGPYWIDPDAGIRPVNARQRRPGGDPAGGRTRCRPGSRQSDDHSRSACSYADPRESLSDIAIAILPDAGWLSPERRPPGGCRIRLTTMCVRGRRWYYVPMDTDRNATSAIGSPPVALSICMVRDRGDDIMYPPGVSPVAPRH